MSKIRIPKIAPHWLISENSENSENSKGVDEVRWWIGG